MTRSKPWPNDNTLDENVPNQTVRFLRDRGDDVLDIRGTDREGAGDYDLLQLAIEQGRLLLRHRQVALNDFAIPLRSSPPLGIWAIRHSLPPMILSPMVLSSPPCRLALSVGCSMLDVHTLLRPLLPR